VSEGRIKFSNHEKLHSELLALKHDLKRNKVDHPSSSSGSKNLADALAAVAYGLTNIATPFDFQRYDVWQHNREPKGYKLAMGSRTTGCGAYFDSGFNDFEEMGRGLF